MAIAFSTNTVDLGDIPQVTHRSQKVSVTNTGVVPFTLGASAKNEATETIYMSFHAHMSCSS